MGAKRCPTTQGIRKMSGAGGMPNVWTITKACRLDDGHIGEHDFSRGKRLPGMKLVHCDGEAHSNAHIDNCGRCAPRWGTMAVRA
jgi:hypothetical protein